MGLYCLLKGVGSDFGGEGCSILYPEVTGGDVLLRKTEAGETQF